jgi:hypothetical protein
MFLRSEYGLAIVFWSFAPSAIVFFPLILLGLLANGSLWAFWNSQVLLGLMRGPHVLLILYFMSALLLAPCVALGRLTIGDYTHFLFLAPVTGFVWSTCLLIYGRLLGRVSWVIMGRR